MSKVSLTVLIGIPKEATRPSGPKTSESGSFRCD